MASTLTDVFGGESQVKGLLCQKALQTLQAAEFGKNKNDVVIFFLFSFQRAQAQTLPQSSAGRSTVSIEV